MVKDDVVILLPPNIQCVFLSAMLVSEFTHSTVVRRKKILGRKSTNWIFDNLGLEQGFNGSSECLRARCFGRSRVSAGSAGLFG